MSWRRRWVGTVVVAVVLGACGDDPPRPATILAGDLVGAEEFADVELSGPEAACAAEAAVADLGEDDLVESGLGQDEDDPDLDFAALDSDDLASVADAIVSCVPDVDATLAVAIEEGILDEPDDTLSVTDVEAGCIADALVDGIGAERLLVLGAVSGDGDAFADGVIGPEETETVADAFLGCIDIREVFREQFVTEGVPEETAACLAREIPDDNLRDLFAAQFAGETIDPDQLVGPALEICGLG